MLYTEGNEMPLPTQEEVLICTPQTTAEEVYAIWHKMLCSIFFYVYILGNITMEKSNR